MPEWNPYALCTLKTFSPASPRRVPNLLTGVLVVSMLWQSVVAPYAFATNGTDAVAVEETDQSSGARVYRITPEQYREIEPILLERGLLPITTGFNATSTNSMEPVILEPAVSPAPSPVNTGTNAGSATVVPPAYPEVTTDTDPEQGPSDVEPAFPDDEDRIHPCHADTVSDDVGDLLVEIMRTDWTSSDASVVIFVVIGAVVVLAVVVYAGAYLYDMATGSDEYLHWWNLETQASFLTGNRSRGYTAGLKLSAGFERNDTRVGAILESGYLDVGIRQEGQSERLDADGVFVMAGVGVRWIFGETPKNPSHFGMELLAGTAWDEQVDVMSVARANLSLGIGSRGRLGFTVGSMFLGLDPTEGILENRSNFTTILGIETGIRF